MNSQMLNVLDNSQMLNVLDKLTAARFETEFVLICRLVYCLVF